MEGDGDMLIIVVYMHNVLVDVGKYSPVSGSRACS